MGKNGVENHAEPNRTQSNGLSLIRFDLFDQVWLVWKSNTQSAVFDLVWLKVQLGSIPEYSTDFASY